MDYGKLIFLNGVSSAGKSSLAKELQTILDEPYFHISIDTFYSMIPDKFKDDLKLFYEEMCRAMHHCIATFSQVKVNAIVDHVLDNKSSLLECLRLLKDFPVLFVGVHCSIEELERREKDRGDRKIGLSRCQLAYVHQHEIYDIEVNTYESTLNECAVKIKAEVDKGNFSSAMWKMYQKYQDEL